MDFFSHLIKIGFPNNCITCNNSLLRNEKFICTTCLFYIPKGELILSYNSETGKLLKNLSLKIEGSHLFDFDKGGKTQQLLHEFKYKSNIKLGVFLGELIGSDFKTQLQDIDYILPVPLHPKKLHERGYNQSKILCDGIANAINKKILTKTLIRERYTETQTKKNKQERIKNIKNAFKITDSSILENKSVLLIDDVITTGSTLLECIKELSAVKNIKVKVIVLAKATY